MKTAMRRLSKYRAILLFIGVACVVTLVVYSQVSKLHAEVGQDVEPINLQLKRIAHTTIRNVIGNNSKQQGINHTQLFSKSTTRKPSIMDLHLRNKWQSDEEASAKKDLHELAWLNLSLSKNLHVNSKVTFGKNEKHGKELNHEKQVKNIDTETISRLTAERYVAPVSSQQEDRQGASSPVLLDGSTILNCITGEIIGTVPKFLFSKPFDADYPLSGTHEKPMERAKSFQNVFDTKAWGQNWNPINTGLTASGRGSTIIFAQEMVLTLHTVISELKRDLKKSRISILDVPCGDMQWMSRFLLTRDDVDYTGMDIVPDLIQHHKETFKSHPWRFLIQDVIETNLSAFDLILNRMMLQHLYFPDVMKALQKFSESGSKYLLTTTHSMKFQNKELDLEDNPGRVRQLNLEIPPVSLTPPLCLQHDGPNITQDGREHFIGLWKLPLQQVQYCEKVFSQTVKASKHNLYSCTAWSVDLDS